MLVSGALVSILKTQTVSVEVACWGRWGGISLEEQLS